MIGAPVEAARVTSLSVIAPTPECSTRTRISSVEILLTALTIASAEPCTSALMTIGNSIVVEARLANIFSRLDRRRGGPLLVEHRLAIGADLAGARLILDHGQLVAGRRHGAEAEHFDREGRRRLLHLAAMVVDHRPDLARRRADHDHVADLQRAALDQHGRERAAALVELCLDHGAFGRRGRDWPSARGFRPGG